MTVASEMISKCFDQIPFTRGKVELGGYRRFTTNLPYEYPKEGSGKVVSGGDETHLCAP